MKNWWVTFKRTGSFSKQPRSGRRKILGRIEKIMIPKSEGKGHHSCRKLRNRLKYKNIEDSIDKIQRYVKKKFGFYALPQAKNSSVHKKRTFTSGLLSKTEFRIGLWKTGIRLSSHINLHLSCTLHVMVKTMLFGLKIPGKWRQQTCPSLASLSWHGEP